MNNEIKWYCILDSEEGRRQEGPVSSKELEAMLSAGKLSADALVWKEGLPDWVQIGEVPDLSHPVPQDASPSVADSTPEEPSSPDTPADTTAPVEPSDTVLISEMDNHTVQFSKSRNVLLITTNDYHAGPLVLTKLALLGFLTAMETLTQEE